MYTSNFLYRTEIDGLRAVAVLSVIIFHFFPKLLSNGYLGVDIFFVISGFLITTQLLKNKDQTPKEQLKSFYTRRIKRLFPALFLFLTLTYVFVRLFFLPTDLGSFENSLIASYTFWANFFFWRDGGYFGGNDQLKPLLHIWSLSVEEQFYLFFPLLLLFLIGLSRKIKYSVAAGVVLITTLSFILWLFFIYISGHNPAFFLLPTRVWQFGLGALVAVAAAHRLFVPLPSSANNFLFVTSVGLILSGIFSNIDFEFKTMIVTIGAMGFIAFSEARNTFLLSIFQSKLSGFLGKISYSLYLYHWPIAVALTYYFVDEIPVVYSLIGVLLSILLGYVSYKWIEETFRYRFNFKSTLSFLAVCLAVSVFVFLTNINKENVSLANTISKASGTFFKCEVSSFRSYGASRACVIKQTKSPDKTIVLLGNSHATMYAPLVSEASPSSSDVLLVPLSGCLPTTSLNLSSKCLAMAKKNLSTVLKEEKVRIVIIGTTWYDKTYFDTDGEKIDKSNLKIAIETLVKEISESGKHPVLFSPIAIPNKDYASELARKLRFNHISEQEVYNVIKFPRAIFDDEFSDINSHFQKLLGNAYVKIYDELCDQNDCVFGTEEMFYFADSNHLSQYSLATFDKTKTHLRALLASLN